MQLGKIVGTVVATQKDSKLEGLKLHIVKSLDLDLNEKPNIVVAVDSVGAGIGEIVLYCSGSSARQTDFTNNKPVDTTIMAIVDQLSVSGEIRYKK